MTHERQQEAYNAGWNHGRWPKDRNFGSLKDHFEDAATDYADGLRDGRAATRNELDAATI